MRKPLTIPDEPQPRNITRADLVMTEGFGLEVDGRMKTVFPTLEAAQKRARDLKFRGRRCAAGCGRRGSGCHALNANASSNLGIAGSILVSWSRSTAQSIAGFRIVQLPARYWCLSTMRQAASWSYALSHRRAHLPISRR